MRDALEFVLSGFWRFAGTVVLLTVVLDGLADIVKAVRKDKP